MVKKNSNPTCFQCNSPLILVSEETIQPEGSLYPQTNTIYRCSNENCQNEKDKQKEERIEQQQKRAAAGQKRQEEIQEKRKLTQALKMQKS